MQPDPYIEFLENWIPGIGEDTDLHDELHCHFHLGFSINDEAKLLGFQLGHHPASNVFHVLIFIIMSLTIYPKDYRNSLSDVKDFYKAYLLGKRWQLVSYWFIPRHIL
mgnify:FL=1|jgi:hypothetical protein|tara:strand:- start:946 stop:1269 length:324 start_codon:yes stop_codon:yes gene_type:complete